MSLSKTNSDFESSRRAVIKASAVAAALGLSAFPNSVVASKQDDGADTSRQDVHEEDGKTKPQKTDREIIMEAGLSEAEADCWDKTTQLAKALFELPELHPMQRQEIADAIHVIQYRILSRPTYSKYLEIAKTVHGPRPNSPESKDDDK